MQLHDVRHENTIDNDNNDDDDDDDDEGDANNNNNTTSNKHIYSHNSNKHHYHHHLQQQQQQCQTPSLPSSSTSTRTSSALSLSHSLESKYTRQRLQAYNYKDDALHLPRHPLDIYQTISTPMRVSAASSSSSSSSSSSLSKTGDLIQHLTRRRCSILKVFYLLVLLVFVATAYLYGMIEIDSHKLVINILPDTGGLSLDYHDSDNNNNNNNRLGQLGGAGFDERFFPNENAHAPNAANGENGNVVNRMAIERKHKRLNEINEQMIKSFAANITRLFAELDGHRARIVQLLASDDLEQIARLRQKHHHALVKLHIKHLQFLRMRAATKKKAADADDADEESEDSEEEKVMKTQLPAKYYVDRELLVKLIKSVNKKASLTNDEKPITKTVKDVCEEFKLTHDLDFDTLPRVWKNYHFNINQNELYSDEEAVNKILDNLVQLPVTHCREKMRGTQIKIVAQLADGTEAMIKPQKTSRDYQTPTDHFYFVDFERHHAEIAAYHVDRLLAFNRVPPTVGRLFNMTADLWQTADSELASTFFYSPGGNTCFTGHCSYYCDTTHATCGKPKDNLEGSVQLILPSKPIVEWDVRINPYRRTYNKRAKAEWEKNNEYCVNTVFQDVNFHTRSLLDMIDAAMFDFLTGNMDRHHHERMIALGNDSFFLHLDNGRSFGRPFQDEMSILAPLRQCCVVRHSTLERLRFLRAKRFSALLDKSLRADPLYPILNKYHLAAIDRRTAIILNEISMCVDEFTAMRVVLDDGY